MTRFPQIYSPYGPRPKRSSQLIMLWMACFLVLLLFTWFMATRHRETTKAYTEEFLRPGSPKIKAAA